MGIARKIIKKAAFYNLCSWVCNENRNDTFCRFIPVIGMLNVLLKSADAETSDSHRKIPRKNLQIYHGCPKVVNNYDFHYF